MMVLILLFSIALLFSGCPASAWEKVRNSENVDELRAFINTCPDDIQVPEAARRIAHLEYKQAVAADTRYAYRTFLERHPDSVHAFEVKRRLEHLDFIQAERKGTLEAVLVFQRTWPGGNYSSKARKLADGLYCKGLLKSRDLDALTPFLVMHPDISCRNDLLVLEEKLIFETAVSSGSVAKLIEFIDDHPSAIATKEARSMLAQKQVDVLVRAARFEKAREVIEKHASSSQHARLKASIEEALLDWIQSSLDPALIRKSADDFDVESKKKLRRWAAKITAHRRSYARLAEATALLRSPLVPQKAGDTTAVDPRQRWLDAETLALSPEEETAEFLLDLLGDSFLQVRKRALESLREVVASLGEVRAGIWLAHKKAQLVPKARTGIMLLKVAVLYELSGQAKEALRRLEEEVESQENPDPFVLYNAARLAGLLVQKNKAATLTHRLSQALFRLYRQRVQAWAGLQDSDRGWLTLRQIYGAKSLWREALAPYLPDANGRTRLSPAEELLGNWVERSRKNLVTLEEWFSEEEHKWKLRSNEYTACQASEPDALWLQQRAAREWEGVVLLVFSGLPEARTTAGWTACCHPRRSTRLLATVMPQIAGITQLGWLGKNL